jgi:hypothetical protein
MTQHTTRSGQGRAIAPKRHLLRMRQIDLAAATNIGAAFETNRCVLRPSWTAAATR